MSVKLTASKVNSVKLTQYAKRLIKLSIESSSEQNQVIDQLEHQGPKHKQVFTMLLLNRLAVLINAIEKRTTGKFSKEIGLSLNIKMENEVVLLPVVFPNSTIRKNDQKNVAKQIIQAPEHELLAYVVALQAIEWSIKNSKK